MEIISPPEPFDAIVVGSGATGGWAAKELTEAGMRVALLEAGAAVTEGELLTAQRRGRQPYVDHASDEQPIQSRCYAFRDHNARWFVSDRESPYTQARPFRWTRMRALGGRTLLWGGQSYRMSDLDFKAASHDGHGDDWPISYADLAPYYDKVERYVGISGTPEGLPQLPDGVFLPGMSMTRGEEALRDAARERFGRSVIIGRTATLTPPLRRYAAQRPGGPCAPGVFAHFTSAFATLADARRTGRLTLVTDAVVSHVVTANGRAAGVAYIDRRTRAPREVYGRRVILCASAFESTRILLHSRLCGASGVLGRYAMDHISGGGAVGRMPGREPRLWAAPPARPNCVYVPRFRNVTARSTRGFIRGYGFQGGSVQDPDTAETGALGVRLSVYGEALARRENYVDLDPERRDAWGIPALRVHVDFCDNDARLWRDGREQAAEMLAAAGARDVQLFGEPPVPGLALHEVGTARMGADPRTSVVDSRCEAHDVPGLFVTDGACWVSSGCQNPTLTMMALTVRSCDLIVRGQEARS